MYLKEISAMMHAFGDVKEPKEKSVQLMLTILHDQMKLLLLEAEKIACFRQSPEISHIDILFLMRKNKMKLKRLIEYLQVWDLTQTINYNKYFTDDEVPCLDLKLCGKRVEKCLKFLASIEDCEEFTSVIKDETIMDSTTTKRKMRRYWMTCKMSSEEYDEFSKCSQATFCPLQKFKQWLLKDKVVCFSITDSAVRIIDFLARETVAEMVDMVLIMKMKKLGKYQPLCYDSFVYSLISKSSLETNNVSKQTNGKGDHKGNYSSSTPSNNISSSYDRDSRNQVVVDKGENLKKFSHENCKENNVISIKVNKDLNQLKPEKSDLLSYNLSRRQQLDEHILQREKNECESKYEALDSGSESRVELNVCSETVDKREAPCIKVDVNKASKEAESKSVPVDFEKSSENIFCNNMQSEMYDVRDISDDDDFTVIPKSAFADRSNDMNEQLIPSDISDTDLLYSIPVDCHNSYNPSNPLATSASTFQGTPVAGTSYQSQESNLQIEDISDTSDYENFPLEAMATCDHKKSLKRKISPNKHPKKIAQEESIVDNSAIANYLSDAAQNEVKYITEPIQPAEILEAYSCFQEPSPMVLIFSNDHVPRKTKLICLAESSSYHIV